MNERSAPTTSSRSNPDARRGARSSAACSAARAFDYDGTVFSAHVPALRRRRAHPARRRADLRRRRPRPRMQELAGEIGRRAADRVDHDARRSFATARENMARGAAKAGRDPDTIDVGCTVVASIDETTATAAARVRARSPACTSPTRSRTSRARPTCCSSSPGSSQDEIRPIAEAMERGGRLAAKAAAVTDAILDKCKPIAGHARRLHRGDRGVQRGRLHARHARAVGRGPRTRRSGCSASQRAAAPVDEMSAAGSVDRRGAPGRDRERDRRHPSFTGGEQAMARAA